MAITTKFWTWAELRDEVMAEFDLEEETFIDEPELLQYANEAIDRAEQEVMGLYEDYFLTNSVLTLVSGTREYSLTTVAPDIYAHKIRRMIYENGSQVYKIARIQDWKKFERMALNSVNNSASLLDYFLVNKVPGHPAINFVPTPRESGAFVTIWYIRQANRLEAPGDILDIPEARNYVVEYMKMKCDKKEKRSHGQVPSGDYPEVLNEMTKLHGTLAAMVPDAENLIEADYSHYEEHS